MCEITNTGCICGGVISESQLKKDQKEYGIWADMMNWIMPDKYYKQYLKLIKTDKKEADKLFKKHAYSMID